MADAAQGIPRMSAGDYLALEHQSPCRHKFVNGVVYAMAGGSREHDFISGDLYSALLGRINPPCQIFTSDLEVQIKAVSEECYYYPDTSVTCSDIDNDRYALTMPALIVEVLSRTTEQADRGYNFEHYRSLASLQEYVLVHQERAGVELDRRRNAWSNETFGPETKMTFDSMDVTLPVAALYKRVKV